MAVAAVVVLGVLSPAAAQPSPGPTPIRRAGEPILVVLDASGSMRADDGSGRPKIDAAKDAVSALVEGVPDGTPLGLRVYGHRTPNTDRVAGCADTELLVPVGPVDRRAVAAALAALPASGYTPIGLSLQAAIDDLPIDVPATVVLVSDGIDTCAPPDPCAVAADLASRRIGLRVETIGFQVDAEARSQLECIAEAAGGRYRDAPDTPALVEALQAFVVVGDPITGGTGPDDAPLLEPGTYRDELQVGVGRWYAVEAEAGQGVDVDVVLANDPALPAAPRAELVAQVRRVDVLGDPLCDEDRRTGIDPAAPAALAVAVPRAVLGAEDCTEPGRSYVVVALTGDPAGDPLRGAALPLQLTVERIGEPVSSPTPAPSPRRPPPPLPPAEPPPPPTSVPVRTRALAGLAAAVLGFGAGRLLADRTGP